MLDEANGNFVNGVVTVVRYLVYGWLALFALGAALWVLSRLWLILSDLWTGTAKIFRIPRPIWESDIDKAKRRMRDLGY